MALDRPPAVSKLGKYELLREQAGSGIGSSWIARSTDDPEGSPQLYTVLRLHRHVLKKTEAAEAFLSEAREAQPFRHPNALALVDSGSHDGDVFVTSEHVEGESLASLLAAAGPEGLAPSIVLRIFLDVLEALSAAHGLEPPLVHGELNPQHIRVGTDGVARISGLAVARAVAKLSAVGAKNHDRLAYAAPERVKTMASPTQVSSVLEPRVDLFSVGVMLWEGITRQRLFASKIEAAVIQKVLTAPIPALSSVQGIEVPPDLEEAVQKSLEREPAKRFHSASEMIMSLEGAGPDWIASAQKVAAVVEKAVSKQAAAVAAKPPAPGTRPVTPGPSPNAALRKPTLLGLMAPPPKPPEASPVAAGEAPKPAEAAASTSSDGKPTTNEEFHVDVDLSDTPAPKEDAAKTAESTEPAKAAEPAKPFDPAKLPPPPKLGTKPSEATNDAGSAPKPPPPAIRPGAKPPLPVKRPASTLLQGTPAAVRAAPAAPKAPLRPGANIVAPKPAVADPKTAVGVTPAASMAAEPPGKTGITPSDTPTDSRRGRTATALDRLGPGSTLGRYEVLMTVARGGMASVWAARLQGTRGFQKIVAIKTMLPDVSDDPDFESMFLDEAKVAARIRHPNVAEILDLGEQDDVLYLVMEWVEGENLSTILKAARSLGGIPLPIALRIASQTCAGLHAAHELRDDSGNLVDLIHRDVSPANVLVSTSGFVKLVDFGVAKSKNRLHVTRAGGMVKGKTPYLSPEQLGQLGIDRRSDIFSFGALLYVMLTGLHPFRGDTEGKTVENIALKEPVAIRNIVPTSPADLEKVVFKALEKDPNKRYATAAELQRAIDQIAASLNQPTTDADVADFIRKAIGDLTTKRAQELRSAIAVLDADVTKPEGARAADNVKLELAKDIAASAEAVTVPGAPAPGVRPQVVSITDEVSIEEEVPKAAPKAPPPPVPGAKGAPKLPPRPPAAVATDASANGAKEAAKTDAAKPEAAKTEAAKTEAAKDAPKDASKEASQDASKEASQDASKEAAADAPKDAADEAVAASPPGAAEASSTGPSSPALAPVVEESTPSTTALDESGDDDVLAPPKRSRSRVQLIVGAAVGACALVGVIALMAGGSGGKGPATKPTTVALEPVKPAPTATEMAAPPPPPPDTAAAVPAPPETASAEPAATDTAPAVEPPVKPPPIRTGGTTVKGGTSKPITTTKTPTTKSTGTTTTKTPTTKGGTKSGGIINPKGI